LVVILLRLRAAIEALVHLPEVFDLDVGEGGFLLRSLGESNNRKKKRGYDCSKKSAKRGTGHISHQHILLQA
jgi:hypothetical protein